MKKLLSLIALMLGGLLAFELVQIQRYTAYAQESTLKTATITLRPMPAGLNNSTMIQAALYMLTNNNGLFVGASGGGEIVLGPGLYNCTGQITLPNTATFPYNIKIRGSGQLNTIVNYVGTTAQDFVITAYNPSNGSTNTLNLVWEDTGITYASNFTQNIVNIGGGNLVTFNRCHIGWYGGLTQNTFGFTANYHEVDLTNSMGLVGVYLKSSQNVQATFSGCHFYALADGILSYVDDLAVNDSVFLGCGALYNGSAFIATNNYTTGDASIGGAVVAASGYTRIRNSILLGNGCALADLARGANGAFHVPELIDCAIDTAGALSGTFFRVATYDVRPAQVKNSQGSLSTGDTIITNQNTTGRLMMSGIKPDKVFVLTTDAQEISAGNSNNAAQFYFQSATGDLTNGGRFSTLGGNVLFNATVTLTTNFLQTSGSGDLVLNGRFVETGVPAALCADALTRVWTNAVTGAYLIFDPGEGCISADDWEWRNSAGAVLNAGNPFDNFPFAGGGSIALNPGVGTAPAIQTFWVSTTRTLTAPTMTLGTAKFATGSGSPENAVTAPVGSIYLRIDGSTSTTLYVKTSGAGNTGWTAK